MINDKISILYPILQKIHSSNETIIISSNIYNWLKLTEGNNYEKIHYIDVREESSNIKTLPKNWSITTQLLHNYKQEVKYYELTNKYLSGTISDEILSSIWNNIKTIRSLEKKAITLKNFINKECFFNTSKMLIIDTFDALNIIENNLNIDIIIAKVIIDNNKIFKNFSKNSLDKKLEEYGYKNIAMYQNNHPKIYTVIYIKDYKKALLIKEDELDNKVNELLILNEEEKENKISLQKEKDALNKELEIKNNELQRFKSSSALAFKQIKEKSEKQKNELDNKVNELLILNEEEKENKISLQKEKDALNKELEIKNNELLKLDSLKKDIYLYKKAKNYYIDPTYISRTEYTHYDDQSCKDEWQLEVYLHALGLMKKYKLKKIVDIGCGSGYKLMKYFDEYKTVGLELQENVEFLKKKYPSKKWLESDFNKNIKIKTDILICSDVIEHLVNPDDLINYIIKIKFKYLILSTPDRELVYSNDSKFLKGPPRNPAHIREWNFDEFNEYISQYFKVIDHRITNMGQSTQTMICKKIG